MVDGRLAPGRSHLDLVVMILLASVLWVGGHAVLASLPDFTQELGSVPVVRVMRLDLVGLVELRAVLVLLRTGCRSLWTRCGSGRDHARACILGRVGGGIKE